MFSKTVTQQIVEYQALGYSAEETRKALMERNGIKIAINTVYDKRRSSTAKELIEELIRKQEQAIIKADENDPALAMKYRNELLKILVPQRIEAYSRVEQSVTTTSIDVSLGGFEDALEESVKLALPSNSDKQQVDTTQTTPQTNPVPATTKP